jgi:lipopolysaccharide transport system ATP-binding protein
LEVGTGFHAELTGRENIYLNGAILGMKKAEIDKKFDEIVAFSEIEKFIDTPVKRYSTGMYVRLAFAVAAHLEPEILIVDEVLAVGDAQFQKKCLGKMGDIAQGGRTVLFVSHNMAAVQRLCSGGVFLDRGVVTYSGDAEQVISKYLANTSGSALVWERSEPPGEVCSVHKVWIGGRDGEPVRAVNTGGSCVVHIEFVVQQPCPGLTLSVGLMNEMDQQIFGTSPADCCAQTPENKGTFRATVQMPQDFLMAKPYGIHVALWHPQKGSFDHVDALRFIPQETASFANIIQGGRLGFITVRCNWSIKQVPIH